MAEYIERETAIEIIDNYGKTISRDCIAVYQAIRDIVGFICPSADVVEVVHGEWIFNRGQAHGEPLYFCSVCTDGGSEWGKDNYCPNCGAKMDGDKNDL